MTPISTDGLLRDLARLGMTDHDSAEHCIDAVVAAIGARIPDVERAALAVHLSRRLRHSLTSPAPPGGASELYEHVRRRTGVRPGRAREEAQTVIGALGRALPREARERLAGALPAEIAELLHDRTVSEPPPHAPSGVTLASGRPGSRHPVSESAPPTAAQAHSVVREDNPHGARKLSSGG